MLSLLIERLFQFARFAEEVFCLKDGRIRRVEAHGVGITLALAALNLTIKNLRWPKWMMFLAPWLAQDNRLLPLQWAANLLIIGIFTFTLVSMVFRQSRV